MAVPTPTLPAAAAPAAAVPVAVVEASLAVPTPTLPAPAAPAAVPVSPTVPTPTLPAVPVDAVPAPAVPVNPAVWTSTLPAQAAVPTSTLTAPITAPAAAVPAPMAASPAAHVAVADESQIPAPTPSTFFFPRPPPAAPPAAATSTAAADDAMTSLLATVLAQTLQNGSSLSADQIQKLQGTVSQLLTASTENKVAAPTADQQQQQEIPLAGEAPGPAVCANPPQALTQTQPLPKGVSAVATGASDVAPPPSSLQPPPGGPPAAAAAPVRLDVNSSSHPKEYRAFQRFCENSKGADEMRKVWVQGGPRRMAVFSQFVATGCRWDGTYIILRCPKPKLTRLHQPLLRCIGALLNHLKPKLIVNPCCALDPKTLPCKPIAYVIRYVCMYRQIDRLFGDK